MKKYVWLVEIKAGKTWLPTIGAYLTRNEANWKKHHDWQYNNRNDVFRVVKYGRIEK